MKIPLDDAYWKMYTIVIQLGAIFALTLLFLGRIVEFMRTFPRGENGDRNWLTHPISLTLIAFFCTNGATSTWAVSPPWLSRCSSAASSCG